MVYIYNGIPCSHQKTKILPFAMTWMELEGIMLNEISQSKKDKYHMLSLIEEFERQGGGSWEVEREKMKQDGTREGDKP